MCIKKIVIYLAGPVMNLFLALMSLGVKAEVIIPKETIIYSNLLLAMFNLLPIYPLDGGRIVKEMIHIFKGKQKAEQKTTNISWISVIVLTFMTSILILYAHNIAFLLILGYLWYLTIKNQKEYEMYKKISDRLNKKLNAKFQSNHGF